MWKFVLLLLAVHLDSGPVPRLGEEVIQQIDASGRCTELGETPDARVAKPTAIAPGPPPLLSFRYYEGKLHHRVGNGELMLDDAGH